MATSPFRYFFSRELLPPRKLQMALVIWPDSTRGLRPPPTPVPALLETAVRECRLSGPRLWRALTRVSAVPQRPKPALRRVEPDLMSATASSAEA